MFDKIYKSYLDLNANTKQYVILIIQDDNVFLTVDMAELVYVGHMSFSGGLHVYDGIRLFERLHAEWFAKWNA